MPDIMARLAEAIEKNVKFYPNPVLGPQVDTTSAVVDILKIYEGDNYENVMRGGQSVAKGLEAKECPPTT